MHNVCAVFAGPSLPARDRVSDDRVQFLPPAARGDVARAALEYNAILLIDSVFLEALAPSPKEVLRALASVPFYGAASAGALRAVECERFGAVPIGTIARWYASGMVDADDELAVVFDARSGEALTVPLVNVRWFLILARRRGLLRTPECAEIFACAQQSFFEDRTWHDVLAPVHRARRGELLRFAARYGNLKRLDAIRAVAAILRSAVPA